MIMAVIADVEVHAVWTTDEPTVIPVHYAPSPDGETEAYIEVDDFLSDVNMNIGLVNLHFHTSALS